MSPNPSPAAPAPASPEAMRQAMADYVRALHQAYLDAAAPLPPGERARMPLVGADGVTVLAVAARSLHLLATHEALPRPTGQEVELVDATGGLTWSLRFFDPVILPGLGLVDESARPQPERIRDLLGVRTVVYHLSVPPGGGLTGHHALHAGTGLAHAHAAAHRDFDTIAALAPEHEALVTEMRGASVAGLASAQLLLARAIAPSSRGLADLPLADPAPESIRRTLLAALREGAA